MSNGEKGGLLGWLDPRLPVMEIWNNHAAKYYAPKNLNFWYFFGAFSFLILANQIITGIWLTMYYVPTSAGAFASVEHIMRDVQFGWLIRYMHSVGASAFFIVVYLHMYRGIMYGSYKAPRELIWIIGMLLYVVLLVESASGYVLPWGQMSYWATKVLVSLFTVIPVIGKSMAVWIAGDYNVSGVTLHRFFAVHIVAFPLIIIFLSWLHMIALHKVGSNNPDGIDIKDNLDESGNPKDGIPFHPYYTLKDLAGIIVFLIVFVAVIFFWPTGGGYFLEPVNFLPANPLVTPTHIAPPWYMAPYYSMLRAVPNKLAGVVVAAAAVAILFVLPWLDRSRVRSIRYRGVFSKIALTIFVIDFIVLGYLGLAPLTNLNVTMSVWCTIIYFSFFILMPVWTRYEKTKPLPKRLT